MATAQEQTASPSTLLVAEMREMVAKYTADFPVYRAGSALSRSAGREDVVLVTGTTGSLGCHLLETLVADPRVRCVYAFNRAAKNGTGLRERQALALLERGIDAQVLSSPKVVLLEGDLLKPNWGLPADTFSELCDSVTHVIHNAWRVDMVAKLQGFDAVLRGLRCLIDFALTSPLPSPPRLLFTSSMVILLNGPRDRPILEAPIPPETALSSGYSQSKWVAEQMMYTAAAKTALDPLVIRVGQVSGGPCGAWAVNEWYPIMVQSALQLGCFPDDARPVNIIPFDIASAAIADFRLASNPNHTVHLVHPRPVAWHSIASIIASELSVQLVSYEDWLGKLEQIARSLPRDVNERRAVLRRLRALQLIPYFKSLARSPTASASKAALNWPDPLVTEAVKASPTLGDANLRQLGAEDVKKWIAYWRKVGFLSVDRQAHL